MFGRSFFLSVFFGLAIFAQGQNSFEKGVVIDSISISNSTDESFALYLPLSYQANTPSSIVFIFEPAARSAVGIQPFIEASEKYGHILVCSNNSRNGPYERNFGIANRLFDHVFSHFNINQTEMYLSGFSGGSRLACAIASLTNKFSGVIACGAGFPNESQYRPSLQDYAYVGVVGDRDMNYREMHNNKGFMEIMNFNYTLITYEGDHSWPPSEEIIRAFDWLYLQKLSKTNSAETDSLLPIYTSEYQKIASLKVEGKLLRVSEQYERLINGFGSFFTVDSLTVQQKELLTSKGYKKQEVAFSNILKLEQKYANKYIPRIQSDLEKPLKVNFGWWEKEAKKLDALYAKDDNEIQKMVYRIKFDLFVRAYVKRNSVNREQNLLAERFIKLFYPN